MASNHEQSLRPAPGLSRLIYDLRHRRDRFRQFLGIVFAIVVSFLGDPNHFFGRPIDGNLIFYPGLVLVVVGVVIRLWASGHVKKDKELATDGPYAFVRHPLYVGNLLISFGFAIASGLWWSFVALALLLALFYPPAIRSEDAKLHRLFGDSWTRWRARTRALIPRLTPYRSEGDDGRGGGWSFRQSLMQNGEPIIAAFLLALMALLYVKLV